MKRALVFSLLATTAILPETESAKMSLSVGSDGKVTAEIEDADHIVNSGVYFEGFKKKPTKIRGFHEHPFASVTPWKSKEEKLERSGKDKEARDRAPKIRK